MQTMVTVAAGSDNNVAGGSASTSVAMQATASTSVATSTAPAHRRGHRRQESFYEMTGLYSEACADDSSMDTPADTELPLQNDTFIKCHSRQASSGLVDRERQISNSHHDIDDLSRDCGILSFRPLKIQKLARIKVG